MNDNRRQPESYQSALDFLFGRINYEHALRFPYRANQLKLDRMRRLLKLAGDPQDRLRIVHVAGTKGKGSTAAMIASMLTAAGYRTGSYSSPHLERIEERIAIDAVPCTSGQFTRLVEQLRPVIEQMDREARAAKGRGPTYYDITTAMALVHFAQQGVELAVLEVGMGGRLDSTNVCQPIVAVITSISFDHTQQLGSTLAAIAGEKAGIIKPGVPVVSGVTQPEPRDVIEGVAARLHCPVARLGREFSFRYEPTRFVAGRRLPGRVDYFQGDAAPLLAGLSLGLLGEHQAANAAIAVAVVREIQRQARPSGPCANSERAIRDGLASAWLPARVEVMSHNPLVILDSAHNVASMEALLATLDESFPPGPRRCVFAGTCDKDVRGMLARLGAKFDALVLSEYRTNPRAIPVAQLEAIAAEVLPGVPRITAADPRAAWDLVRATAAPGELVCVAGSFFLAAELRRHIASHPIAPPAAGALAAG